MAQRGLRIHSRAFSSSTELPLTHEFCGRGGKRGITFSETVPISNKRTRFTMPTTVVHSGLRVQRNQSARYLPFFLAVLSILITAGRGRAASVSVAPTSVSLTASQTQQFKATVTGTANTGVTWSLSPAVGTISSIGVYTAPPSIASAQNVTVTATSVADPTKSATASVTPTPPVGVTVAPASVTLTQSQAQTFSATVTNTGNTAVTWSLSPVVGSITAAGLYTAPASIASSQTICKMSP